MTRAVLFDFGGTLYDYATLAPGDAESLLALARWAGLDADLPTIRAAQREAMRAVFRSYLPRRYYLHRDLFRDAAAATLRALGAEPDPDHLDRFRALQWELHQRDFQLREGVIDTLEALRARGLHVGMVSNIDDDQLAHLLEVAGLRPHFDSLLSSEAAGACKPDPAIFAEALRRADCAASEAIFVGDTLAQDIAGANAMGMRSVLIWHREDRQPAADGARPAHVIRRIPELLDLL
ncbi:HAD family hydrolase [bacterium]|nr:HAD family hydrolase [bacterium]